MSTGPAVPTFDFQEGKRLCRNPASSWHLECSLGILIPHRRDSRSNSLTLVTATLRPMRNSDFGWEQTWVFPFTPQLTGIYTALKPEKLD